MPLQQSAPELFGNARLSTGIPAIFAPTSLGTPLQAPPWEIKGNCFDELRLEAKLDNFTAIADQPIRYKGDGSAPGQFGANASTPAACAAFSRSASRVARGRPVRRASSR